MGSGISRRQVLKTGIAAIAATAMPQKATADEPIKKEQKAETSRQLERLPFYAVTHGGIQQVRHSRLGVEVDGQTCIRYLRFGRPATLDRLEIARLVYGRWIPRVPTHPAHIIISKLDGISRLWQTIREIDLPLEPKIVGEGLSQEMSIEEMDAHFDRVLKEPAFKIDLAGTTTDHLRVVCDREHPGWPNHGECNGGSYNVPFGILDKINVYGKPSNELALQVGYHPVLKRKDFFPQAPKGMKVVDLPEMLVYKSKYMSIGFSLYRPLVMHLGWDVMASAGSAKNKLFVSRKPQDYKMMGGASGPILRTIQADYPAHLWTGEVSVQGNKICYHNLSVIKGLTMDAIFTVADDNFTLELMQTCSTDMPVIEAEAWRFAWDLTRGITGMAGLPTLRTGRNGDVALPAMWATDGYGCLACDRLQGNADQTRMQVESYRSETCVTGGFVLGEHPGPHQSQFIPAGERHAIFEFTLSSLQPQKRSGSAEPSDGLKMHWGTVFACFRPEYRGFSNHSASVNCHLSQGVPMEIVAHTKHPGKGPNPIDLARFTVGKAILDGGGYGYFRNLYLDSDPVLLSAAGRIHQVDPNTNWLRKIEAGLVETVQRILSYVGKEGLLVCKDLSGNSGSYRWSSNGMDVVGFGHIDGYVNAWAYRALRNAAAMLDDLSPRYADLVMQCKHAAQGIRENYAPVLLNPQTNWVAGWRSRDGQLHDYAFLWVNGVALAFGLLDPDICKKALSALERTRQEVGPASARIGLPCNLLPIREDDQMLGKILNINHPTFETYTDGSLSGWPATYYLRALSIHGLKDHATKLANELLEGYQAGIFNGGHGSGHEFRSWEGLPTGYEGTLIGCFGPMYAIAIIEGIVEPTTPEWWPANG